MSDGLSTSADWISNYLPDVFYDIDQGGNARKSVEAEALFKLICLACIIESYKGEIIEHIKNYDFDMMISNKDAKYDSFVIHLQKFQDLNSVRLNSIFSAASFKIYRFREKSESYYTGLLGAEETSKLESLSRSIKSVIARYEREKELNPSDMSKISKLELIDARDREIEKLVNDSDVSMVYKISKLTSERIPNVLKNKVFEEAELAAKKEVADRALEGFAAEDVEQCCNLELF